MNTDIDIDALLRQMAKADGYDARKLLHTDRLLNSRFDTAPCEQEQPEIEVEYVPETIDWPLVIFRALYAVLMAATIAGVIAACAYFC